MWCLSVGLMTMKFNLSILFVVIPLVVMAGEETVTVKFRAVAPGLSPLLVECPHAKPSAIEIPEGGRSGLHTYRGVPEAKLQDSNGSRVFPVVFPETDKSLLVVLTMSEAGTPISHVLEDDLESIPAGDLCFLNLGSMPLEVIVAETSQVLAGGQKVTVPIKGRSTAFVRVIDPATGESLHSNNWGLSPKIRTLALLEIRGDNPKSLVLHRLTDSEASKK